MFEKNLILKHLEATGQCPLTGIDLSAENDLIPLQVAKAAQPKPLSASNVPNMLQLISSEWDALMLEVFTLRKNNEETRKELSHALYQHDAACQVICKLIQEKEELQAQLDETLSKFNDLKNNFESNQTVAKSEEMAGIFPELQDRMEKLSDKLIESRKTTKAPETYPKKEELA